MSVRGGVGVVDDGFWGYCRMTNMAVNSGQELAFEKSQKYKEGKFILERYHC